MQKRLCYTVGARLVLDQPNGVRCENQSRSTAAECKA